MARRSGLGQRGLDILIPEKNSGGRKKDAAEKTKRAKKSKAVPVNEKNEVAGITEAAEDIDGTESADGAKYTEGLETAETVENVGKDAIAVDSETEDGTKFKNASESRDEKSDTADEGNLIKSGQLEVDINLVEPNRDQPRKNFSDEAISALADSIREHGMLQPILVRPISTGSYQIVAGERRWRAARMLGLDEVPVTIRELSDAETMQIAIIENLQRENLNPIEEANGYNELIEKFGMTQEKVAKMVGRSRSAVANAVRLLTLPDRVVKMLENGEISAGHGRALLGFQNEELLIATALRAVDGGLTVRQVERAAQKSAEAKEAKASDNKKIDNYFVEMELSLNERLGRRVKVDYGKNKGALILEFYDKEDLAALADKLAKE